jgi:hypothetical protein
MSDETDYAALTKEQLIDKIRKLECHVKQLRNVINKRAKEEGFNNNSRNGTGSSNDINRRKKARFDNDGGGEEVDVVDDDVGGESTKSSTLINKANKKVPRPFDFTK